MVKYIKVFDINCFMKGNIYLWTGHGWGKTTSAIGAAIRAAGHGYRVIFIQFMKGRATGEYKLLSKIKNIEIHQFGRKGWVNLKKPSLADKKRAQHGLEFARKIIKKKPFLFVLDEINLAVAVGLLKEKEVVDFLKELGFRYYEDERSGVILFEKDLY